MKSVKITNSTTGAPAEDYHFHFISPDNATKRAPIAGYKEFSAAERFGTPPR